MTDELRKAAEIAGTRAFPAHPHFRGTGADLYIAGYEAGKPKWIPIRSADDLPKVGGSYLWKHHNKRHHFAENDHNTATRSADYYVDRFCAYMPIPPYTEGE